MSTLREMRRRQQREDIRNAMAMGKASGDVQRAALFKNGITFDDVRAEYKRGWNDAKKFVEEFCFHTIYASVLIVLDEEGVERDRLPEILKKIDRQVVLCVEDKDLAEEAYEKTGLSLQWDDPIERVQEG